MLLLGDALADTIKQELKKAISLYPYRRKPALALLVVGDDTASHTYVGMKKKACEAIGMQSRIDRLPNTISEEELLGKIRWLNADLHTDGILVQLPLPPHINPYEVMATISPSKDVDGFHPMNIGKLLLGEPGGFIPCTPLAVSRLLDHYQIETCGKNTLILGRSTIVGKPLAALLMQRGRDATVTVAHSKTQNLPSLMLQADILIAAIGKPKSVTADMVKEGAVVIDVGINRVKDSSSKGYKLVGDVAFDEVAPKCQAITPVPRGIGPMTVAMLLYNTCKSYNAQIEK